MIDPLAQAFDDECKRVARDEDLRMEDLVKELAQLCSVKPRQIYNYRTGKWPLPARLVPILSRRFGSTALQIALKDSPREHSDGIPVDCRAVPQRAMELLRSIVDHHSDLIRIMEGGSFDANDLRRLEQQTERIVQAERAMYACVEIELDLRRQEQRGKKRA